MYNAYNSINKQMCVEVSTYCCSYGCKIAESECVDFMTYSLVYVCLFHALVQYGSFVLSAAAESGNVTLFDWLVTTFELQALTRDESVRNPPILPCNHSVPRVTYASYGMVCFVVPHVHSLQLHCCGGSKYSYDIVCLTAGAFILCVF